MSVYGDIIGALKSVRSPLAARPHLPAGLGYTAGKYYSPAVAAVSFLNTSTLTASLDYAVPFLCRKTTTFDRIALYNTEAVATTFRLGIYNDDGGGHPGTLLVDGGELTCSGAAADNVATISQSLTGGSLYWLVFNCSANLAVAAFGSPGAENLVDFANATQVAISSSIGFPNASRAYAAFPATATAWSIYAITAPFIRLRAA